MRSSSAGSMRWRCPGAGSSSLCSRVTSAKIVIEVSGERLLLAVYRLYSVRSFRLLLAREMRSRLVLECIASSQYSQF